jgi:hypothetical protein
MKIVKDISFYTIISLVLNFGSYLLQSTFLNEFISKNLILLLINVLAINIATTGIVLTKLKELAEKFRERTNNQEFDFTKSYVELRNALREQLILILVSIIFMVCKESSWLSSNIIHFNHIINVLLTATFIFALDILRDTAAAIFLIVKKD